MGCLVDKAAEPCIHYCNQLAEYTNMVIQQKWDCYKDKGVPIELYGRTKCEIENPKLNSLAEKGSFLECLKTNK